MLPINFKAMQLRMETWIFFTVFWTSGFGLTCLDSNGNSVDWFSVYKAPKIENSDSPLIRVGVGHFNFDLSSAAWTLADKGMNESGQAVYETLSAIYNSKSNDGNMYLMYNDEGPKDVASNGGGHTKGVVAFDNTSGFWLIHSVPHFPPVKSHNYGWPETALKFGQTFLCVSFKTQDLGKIATQLLYNQPNIYDYAVPDSFLSDFPRLSDVIAGKKPPGPPWSSVIQLTSANGHQDFTSFAKSGKFGADLYDSLVAPSLKQNLLVETWLNGGGTKLGSNCSITYKVMKIDNIQLPRNVAFKETEDHSKWAVSYSDGSKRHKVLKFQREHSYKVPGLNDQGNWVCIGDINRMRSQFKRGGGTMCLQHSSLWTAFNNSVTYADFCPLF